MQAAGGAYENFAAFDYDVHAAMAGQFTMPEFTVEVYGKPVVIPAAQLEVKMDLPEPHEPVRQLFLAPSATNIFVGEKFDVSVILPATTAGAVEGVSDVQFNGDSFVVDNQMTRQSIQPVAVNGRNALAYIYKTSLTPIAAGKLNLSVQGFSLGDGRLGGPPKIVLLDSEPVMINVRPLPVGNELPGFQGAVGDYTCDPPILTKSDLKVGEPTQLTIVIRGRRDPGRINPPLPSRVEGWQMFPAERAGRPGGARMPGVSFRYTLIPLTDAVRTTPAIPFSCFNPASGRYVDLTIPTLPVTVFAGEKQTNADTGLVLPEDDLEPGPKAGLSKLAPTPGWIRRSRALANARLVSARPNFPALGFCGLWYWNRRRHFLEQHPEIVRRREARRAIAPRTAAVGKIRRQKGHRRFCPVRDQRPANRQRAALSGGAARVGLRRCFANFNCGGTRRKIRGNGAPLFCRRRCRRLCKLFRQPNPAAHRAGGLERNPAQSGGAPVNISIKAYFAVIFTMLVFAKNSFAAGETHFRAGRRRLRSRTIRSGGPGLW